MATHQKTVQDGGANLLTVCVAVGVGGLGRVATAHQIAPWSEDQLYDLPVTPRRRRCFPEPFFPGPFRWRFGTLPERHGHRTETQIRHKLAGRTPRKVVSAASYSAGHGYGPAGRAEQDVPNPRARSYRRTKRIHRESQYSTNP